MGLFDRLTGGSVEAPLNKQEGFAAILYAVIAADGHISDEEVDEFVARISRMKLFADLTQGQFGHILDKIRRTISKKGVSTLITESAQALSPELKETAFVVAVDMIFADGIVEDEEKALVETIQGALEISDSLAAQALDIFIIKNRG
jgi:tellurite resistance protein